MGEILHLSRPGVLVAPRDLTQSGAAPLHNERGQRVAAASQPHAIGHGRCRMHRDSELHGRDSTASVDVPGRVT